LKEVFKEDLEVPIESLTLLPLIRVDEEAPLKEVYEIMQKENIGSVIVTKFDVLAGIITERDFILRVLGKFENFEEMPVKEFMTKRPFAIKKEASLLSLIEMVSVHDFRHIPVIDEDGVPVNIISIRDLVKFITDLFPEEVKAKGSMRNWTSFHSEMQFEDFSLERNDSMGIKGEIFFQPLSRAINDNALILDVSLSVQEVLKRMQEEKKGAVILVEYETMIRGIITERDFVLKIIGKNRLEDGPLPVSKFMTPNPDCLLSRHILSNALNSMFERGYRNIIIVNEDRQPVTVVSMLDIFKFICDHMILEHHHDDIVR